MSSSSPSVASAADALGIEADPAAIPWDELPRTLARAGPALIEVRGEQPGFIALLAARGRRRLTLLAPDGRRRRLSTARLAEALRLSAAGHRGPASGPGLEPLLAGLGLSAARLARLRQAFGGESLHHDPDATLYLLTSPADSPLRQQLRRQRLVALAVGLLACRAAQRVLLVLAWGLLAAAALGQGPAAGWLSAWPLLLLTLAAARLGERTLGARLLARGATLLRRCLVAALLALDPDSLRLQGTGQLLGRILSAESLESLRLAGLPGALLALADLVLALPLLCAGAAPAAHALLALAWLLLAGLGGHAYFRSERAVAKARRAMTHDLVEQLAGHRTRLAQESPDRRHAEEDVTLASYHALCRRLDFRAALVRTVLPGAWLVAALAALIPAAARGSLSAARLAVSLGGVVLASTAWSGLAASLLDLAAAASAAAQLRPLFRPEPTVGGPCRRPPEPDLPLPSSRLAASQQPSEPILEARDLSLRLPGRAEPLAARCNLAIHSGDRLLLAGPSGAGKSTLARVLAADLSPCHGLLLLHGLDLPTVGVDPWRGRVVLVPQLHSNHLFAESLAFNLLLGRGWPPSAIDLDAAEGVCRELGLGPLLDRMPAGLEQRVGEAGWRLSEGETARVCLARALLQAPDLVILDESFGALDPATLVEVLADLDRRLPALLLIAHS